MPGAILCGGRSRRMGRDKAGVEIDGQTLADRSYQTLGTAGCRPVVLVGPQPLLQELELPLLSGEGPLRHPLSGIVHALQHFGTRVLFTPVDLPCLRSEHIQQLLQHEGCCVATGPDQEVQPLLCVLGPEHLGAAKELLLRQGSAHTLVQSLPRVKLPREALVNCNELADLAEIAPTFRVS